MDSEKMFEMADRLRGLRDEKAEMEKRLKEINGEIDETDFRLSELMAETETQNFRRICRMAKKNAAKEEVAVMRPGFLALADFNMDQTMAEELEGLEGGFDRVKIPAGGTTMFELPGDEADEPEGVKEFSAVILYHHPLQQYYATKYTGGSNPPDCGSFDGVMGEGEPGGVCANCPLNQFGSGENNSKACKNRRRVFLLREGELFPLILSLPTGSMKEFSRYIKRLLSKGRKSNSVVTRFSLKKATNSSGIAYSQAQFSLDRPLTSEEQILITKLSEQVKGYSRTVGFDMEEAAEPDVPFVDPETGEVIPPL